MLLGSISSTAITKTSSRQFANNNKFVFRTVLIHHSDKKRKNFPSLMIMCSCCIWNSYNVVCDKGNRRKLKNFYYEN